MDEENSSYSSSNEASTSTSGGCKHPRPKKKVSKSYHQKFKAAWMQEKQFMGWLKKSIKSTASKDIAFCMICNTDVTCGKSEIVRHANSQRHKTLALQNTQTKSLASYVISNDPLEKRS